MNITDELIRGAGEVSLEWWRKLLEACELREYKSASLATFTAAKVLTTAATVARARTVYAVAPFSFNVLPSTYIYFCLLFVFTYPWM